MADITSDLAQNSAAACPPDLIQLHAAATNCLQRSLKELRSEAPCYELLAQQLATVAEAVGLLRSFNSVNAH